MRSDEDPELAKCVGQNIKRIRLERRLRQIDLAEKTGIDYRHLQKIEAGGCDLRLGTLSKLAYALDLEPSELVQTPGMQKGRRIEEG